MKLTMLLLALAALVACTSTEGKDVTQQDSVDTAGGGDVTLDSAGLDGLPGDGLGLDGQGAAGAVSVTGTLSVSDAPITAMSSSAYWIGLYPPDFQDGDDPITSLLGIFSFAPGVNYTGSPIGIPSEGNTFLHWDYEAEDSPVMDYPYAATPGNYIVVVTLALDDSTAHTAAYYYATEVVIPSAPYSLDLGTVILDPVPAP